VRYFQACRLPLSAAAPDTISVYNIDREEVRL
jgi:hypothetical protein